MATISPAPSTKPNDKSISRMDSWADVIAEGGQVVLHHTNWEQYERFHDYFAERGFGRVSYCDGILEIMSLSTPHERVSQILTLIIHTYGDFIGLMVDGMGSATIREQKKDAGKEPDQSFRFSDDREIPDLAIEVVVTSEAIDKLSFYARFGIREVWIWKEGEIAVHDLKKDGSGYRKTKKSIWFPDLDMALVERCTRCEKSGQAIAEFRAGIGV